MGSEVERGILYLTSSYGQSITGTNLVVDGDKQLNLPENIKCPKFSSNLTEVQKKFETIAKNFEISLNVTKQTISSTFDTKFSRNDFNFSAQEIIPTTIYHIREMLPLVNRDLYQHIQHIQTLALTAK